MKSVMGLGDIILNSSSQSIRKEATDSKVAFGQFMQQYRGSRVANTNDKTVLGKDEQRLLEQSLVHLINFRLELLSGAKADGNLTEEKLKKLLQKMGQDPDFMLALNGEMKTLLQKLLRQLKEQGELDKVDMKKLDELVKFWNRHLDKKREKMLAEVEELISAVQERLALAGIQAKVQMVEKDGEKSAQVTFLNNKNAKNTADFGQMLSNKSEDKEMPVLAKNLLNRISNFLTGTDGTSEKSALNAETLNLREAIKAHIKRETQPVGWKKEELVHRAQQNTLDELGPTAQKEKLVQDAVTATVEKFIKEEAKESGKDASLIEEQVELTATKENEVFLNLLSNVESAAREVRNTAETVLRGEDTYQPRAEELFQQMVEKFRLDLKQGVTQMEIKLYPEELGKLHLKLVMENGALTAHFLTENARVKELIEQNIAHLRETFANEGIRWEKITVDVDQQALNQNPFAYQGQQNLKDGRNSNRRQNFADSLTDELRVEEAGLAEGEVDEANPVRKQDPDRILDYMA